MKQMNRRRVIQSGNPHWCLSYIKNNGEHDDYLNDLIKVIKEGDSIIALYQAYAMNLVSKQDLLNTAKRRGVFKSIINSFNRGEMSHIHNDRSNV